MSGGPISALQSRTLAWQSVFVIGVASLGIAGLKAWWTSTPAPYQAPTPPMQMPPAPAPSVSRMQPAPTQPFKPASPVSSIIGTVPPASSFAPSRIAPAALPPELSGLDRPPPDPAPYVPPIGVQPGYVIPQEPQPRDIR